MTEKTIQKMIEKESVTEIDATPIQDHPELRIFRETESVQRYYLFVNGEVVLERDQRDLCPMATIMKYCEGYIEGQENRTGHDTTSTTC